MISAAYILHFPLGAYGWLVAWTLVTLAIGFTLSLKRTGYPAWLRIVLLVLLLFIGHVVAASFSLRGLPNILQVLLFPLLIIWIPVEYYDAAMLARLPDGEATSYAILWGGTHAILMYLYVWVNYFLFRRMARRPAGSLIASDKPSANSLTEPDLQYAPPAVSLASTKHEHSTTPSSPPPRELDDVPPAPLQTDSARKRPKSIWLLALIIGGIFGAMLGALAMAFAPDLLRGDAVKKVAEDRHAPKSSNVFADEPLASDEDHNAAAKIDAMKAAWDQAITYPRPSTILSGEEVRKKEEGLANMSMEERQTFSSQRKAYYTWHREAAEFSERQELRLLYLDPAYREYYFRKLYEQRRADGEPIADWPIDPRIRRNILLDRWLTWYHGRRFAPSEANQEFAKFAVEWMQHRPADLTEVFVFIQENFDQIAAERDRRRTSTHAAAEKSPSNQPTAIQPTTIPSLGSPTGPKDTPASQPAAADRIYQRRSPPGVPNPKTGTITLSADGRFRYEMSLSPGRAIFLGTWSQSGENIKVTLKQKYAGDQLSPEAIEYSWQPGSSVTMQVFGDFLYKDSLTPFFKIQ